MNPTAVHDALRRAAQREAQALENDGFSEALMARLAAEPAALSGGRESADAPLPEWTSPAVWLVLPLGLVLALGLWVAAALLGVPAEWATPEQWANSAAGAAVAAWTAWMVWTTRDWLPASAGAATAT